MVHSTSFAPWRKRMAQFHYWERKYDQLVADKGEKMFQVGFSQLPVPATADAGNSVAGKDAAIEIAFLSEYRQALAAMHLKQAPTQLAELVHVLSSSLTRPSSGVLPQLRSFTSDLILGRQEPYQVGTLVDIGLALELLSLIRLFLAVLRVSRAYLPTYVPSQMAHVLDADCRDAMRELLKPLFLPPVGTSVQLTDEQARFVNHDVRPGQVVKVQAFAGTGKTQSLLAYAQRRPGQRFLYIAFNTSAAQSARTRFPMNVECRTMHSVALAQVTLAPNQKLGNLRPREVASLLEGEMPEGRDMKAAATQNDKLSKNVVATYIMRTLQRFLFSDDDEIDAEKHVPYQLATDTDLSVERVAECARKLWTMIRDGTAHGGRVAVRCPHDAYVKLLHLRGAKYPDPFFQGYDVLLLDEAQDLSAAQACILLRARRHCGILIVGDVHQKIYGFRGGTAKAFNDRLYPPSATFQLTRSFRFGDAVAQVASKVLGLKAAAAWEERPNKPSLSGAKGCADRVSYQARSSLQPPTTGDEADSSARAPAAEEVQAHTRIYRSNKTLCLEALSLSCALPEPHKLYLKTAQSLRKHAILDLLRDGYILYTNSSASMSRSSLLREFASWKELEERVKAEDGGGDTQLGLVAQLSELFGSADFDERLGRLDVRFAAVEEEATVILTTCHQAKGLEWERVVVADDFRPDFDSSHVRGVQVRPLWMQDELNHMYVAVTRAKAHLVISTAVAKWLTALDGFAHIRPHPSSPCPTAACTQTALVRTPRIPYASFTSLVADPPAVLPCPTCLASTSAHAEAEAEAQAPDELAAEYAHTALLLSQPAPAGAGAGAGAGWVPLLECRHRLTVWAMMHDSFKQAVSRWIM